jgi:hypothetical protein
VKKEAARALCKFYVVVVAKMKRSAEVCGGLRKRLRWSAQTSAQTSATHKSSNDEAWNSMEWTSMD